MDDHYFSGLPAVPPDWVHTNSAEASAAAYDESFSLPSWSLPSNASSTTAFHVNDSSSWSIPVEESIDEFPAWSVPVQDSAEDKAAFLSKSHSQAEKRRRDRINAQLGILRKLIPKSDKMDKAALLGSAIDQVKELKFKATEVSKSITVPTEFDEVTVDIDESVDVFQQVSSSTSTNKATKNIFIRVSVCCDDRPEVFSELIGVMKNLKLSIVSADIASVGGRVKSILVVCNKDCNDSVSLNTIKQSLNLVLSRISSSSMPSNYRIRSKRQRFFLPSE